MIRTTTFILVGLMTLTTHLSGQIYTLAGNAPLINWTGYAEAGGFSQKGVINIQSSEVAMDEEGRLSGKVIIDMRSILHESKKLPKHLKNKDFFDVKTHPTAVLQFEQSSTGEILGELLLKGITGKVNFLPKIEKKGNQIIVTCRTEDYKEIIERLFLQNVTVFYDRYILFFRCFFVQKKNKT